MTAIAAIAADPTINGEPAVASHEIGLMFVHEYYTFLNKEPSRLHCFYNKESTMSHGVQGEETQVCHGQQEIHTKIMEIGFDDCRVNVSSVDSQSSLNGGIVIQVLGEMSNKVGTWQKFIQTFFLAVQPRGFYVLNDIFRFLKEDSDLDDEDSEETISEPVVEEQKPQPQALPIPPEATEEKKQPTEQVAEPVEEPKVEVVEDKKAAPAPEERKPVEKKTEKKHEKKSDKKKEDAKEAKKDNTKKDTEAGKPKDASKKQQNGSAATPAVAETPAPVESTPTPEAETVTPTSTPAAPAAEPVVEAAVVAAEPAPSQPPKPKTWANLAANNLTQWGSHVAQAKGSSINIAQPTPKPQPAATQGPSQTQAPSKPHPSKPREDVHSIYVKGVTDKMTQDLLREAFGKFGTVKHIEVVPKRNCAYVDFSTAEAMQAALDQNKVTIGSEVALAEERRPSRSGSFQNGGRPYHGGANGRYEQKPGSQNGHQAPQTGYRGRPHSNRGGYQDRKPVQRPDKAAPTVAVQ